MFENWQIYYTEVVTGQRKGIIATFLRGFLYVLSWGFRFLVTFRNWAFDRRYLRRYSPPVPLVISIGNIVAGGTGKTPVTLMLAQEFYPDIPLAILSRGYKSRAEKLSKPVVLSDGHGPLHPAEHCGDEPYLLAQHLPKAIVIVGKNRYEASNMASHAGAHVILLDDGMQHRRLGRDFEIIVVHAQDAFGQGYFLPRGFLREQTTALSRADLIIVNHITDADHFADMEQQLAPYTKAPAVGTKMEVARIWDSKKNQLPTLKGMRVGIFCGIAHPDQFQKTVEEQGAEIVAHHFTSDHDKMDAVRLNQFAEKCHSLGAEMLVCTEKDFVKITEQTQACLPISWLEMRLCIIAGEPHWKDFIDKAKEALSRRI